MSETFEIFLEEGKKVNVKLDDFLIETDQNEEFGGENSAPSPMNIFLASIGACTGVAIKSFCKFRKISTQGIMLKENIARDHKTGKVINIELKLTLPDSFPNKYKDAILRAAKSCTVKKHIISPPEINISF